MRFFFFLPLAYLFLEASCRVTGKKHTMHTLVHHHEIYHAYSKQKHFKTLKQKTKIDYSEMIFFDNQMNNIHDVSELGFILFLFELYPLLILNIGVHCVYCPEGLTEELWNKGLIGWQEKVKSLRKIS